jgi:hypothetical protein
MIAHAYYSQIFRRQTLGRSGLKSSLGKKLAISQFNKPVLVMQACNSAT